MAGPSEVAIREPAVAGTFYPAEPDACQAQARELISTALPQQPESSPPRQSSPRWLGGVVPHAGWICSGAIAGQTIAALAGRPQAGEQPVGLVVIFGAVHTAFPLDVAVLDSFARWREPNGACDVNDIVRRRIAEAGGGLVRVDDRFHRVEHAIEVELPLVHEAWPEAAILPVEVPLIESAVAIGRAAALAVVKSDVPRSFWRAAT